MGTLRIVELAPGKQFECQNGKRKFRCADSLSFNFYRELQKVILEFSFSATFVDIFKNVRAAYDCLNGNTIKPADAAVILHNIMLGIRNLEDKPDPALRLCALFILEEGEDQTIYDESKIREKIDCWSKELDVSPFFHFASNQVPNWINAYRLVSRDGSDEENRNEKESIPLKTE